MRRAIRSFQSAAKSAGLALLIAATCGCGSPVVSAPVTSADVELAVQPDGGLDVREQFDAQASAATAVLVRRVVSHTVDRLSLTSVSLDGRALSRDAGVTVREGRALDVRVAIPADGASHHVVLRYRAYGVAAIVENHGHLDWPVFTADRSMSVGAVRVALLLPEGQRELGPTGIAEPGWDVTRAANGIVATRGALGDEPASLIASFSIDRSAIGVPAWQVTDDLRGEFAPGVRVRRAVRARHRGRDCLDAARKAPTATSRRGWHAARRSAAGHRRRVGSALGGTGFGGRKHDARLAEMERAGLLDRERLVAAAGLRTTAIAGGVFAFMCAAAAAMLLPRFGWWAQLVPASLFIVAVGFFAASRRLGVLTERGERARAAGGRH